MGFARSWEKDGNLYFYIRPRISVREIDPSSLNIIHSKTEFRATVTRKTLLKEIFFDLCRINTCAAKAPAHPPNIDKLCSRTSEILQPPSCAADLSIEYAKNVIPLIIT
jgi:hypothetical protein